MKAIVYTKYGPPDVLHLEEVKKPALNEDTSTGKSPCSIHQCERLAYADR